jgi:TolB-like protein
VIARSGTRGQTVAPIPDTTQTAARTSAGLPEPSAVEVRAELERILSSRCFEQAARSSKFLRFVVEQTLAGQGDRLKGYTIAIEVFGRPPDFDAQSDPLVRVEAGRLRRRLTEYYADEGRADAVRIELPRGSYSTVASYHPPPAEVLLGPMPSATAEQSDSASNRRKWRRIRSVLIALVVLAGLGVFWRQLEVTRETANVLSPATVRERTAGKPPIVVLPFENLGGEPANGELAAALREEILLLLDDPEVFVVATQTATDAAASAGDTTSFVLSGSVRAVGDQVRITARLLAPGSGTQIWSAAFDESLSALRESAGQRGLARRIAVVAEPYGPIFQSEVERVKTVAAADTTLFNCVVKYYEYRRLLERGRHADALACFERATERDPSSAQAWGLLSLLAAEQYAQGYLDQVSGSPLDGAREAARHAMDIDGGNLHANLALAGTAFFGGENFRPVAERVLQMWPDNGEARGYLGALLILSGDTARGLALVDVAVDTTERAPSGYHATRALAALRQQRIDDALQSALGIDSPDWPLGQVIVTSIAALAGRADIAARARARALMLDPSIDTTLPDALRRWRVEPVLAAEITRGFTVAARL